MKLSKTIIYSLVFIFFLSISGGLKAQVTIGSAIEPNKGALLDLKEKNPVDPDADNSTASKGLGLPRVNLTTLTAISDISEAVGEEIEHTGLMVYNVNDATLSNILPGIYIWDGTRWIKSDVTTLAPQQFFYMPSFNLPLNEVSVDNYYPIYSEYVTQFTKAGLPVYAANEIEFRVTHNEPTLIDNISFPSNYGNQFMKYDIISDQAPEGSYLNIIIIVK
ncbi:hypothetical protein D0T84_10880 [Dysgonomonas sp. 521]|uniref:hypothetical protein n=1 Tax=Dysgonomonas sp. 521 TaxID=2302932 RepID=UPI0013D34BBC|nr:hypothetical protein [Dysgonomonas sp. 521]NDV95415.1 hypothetical protein [Dysgonomonas sp. 521]